MKRLSDERLKEWSLLKDNIWLIGEQKDMAKELLAAREVVKNSKALRGDFTASDDEPTHYNSWFGMCDAQDEYDRVTKGGEGETAE